MLRRFVLGVVLVTSPNIVFAIQGAITRPEASAAEAQAAREQLQADRPTPPPQPAPTTGTVAKKPGTQPTPYQFAASAYLGLSLGPRNTYNGNPIVNKGFAIIGSAGAATMLTPKLYFAGEIFLSNNPSVRDFPGIVSVRSSWNYGFDVIPGYMVTTYVLGYLRIGVESTKFTQPESNATAWRLGLGGETNLKGRWDLRGEYVYSGYKRIAIGRAHIDQFNLGIIYKFI